MQPAREAGVLGLQGTLLKWQQPLHCVPGEEAPFTAEEAGGVAWLWKQCDSVGEPRPSSRLRGQSRSHLLRCLVAAVFCLSKHPGGHPGRHEAPKLVILTSKFVEMGPPRKILYVAVVIREPVSPFHSRLGWGCPSGHTGDMKAVCESASVCAHGHQGSSLRDSGIRTKTPTEVEAAVATEKCEEQVGGAPDVGQQLGVWPGCPRDGEVGGAPSSLRRDPYPWKSRIQSPLPQLCPHGGGCLSPPRMAQELVQRGSGAVLAGAFSQHSGGGSPCSWVRWRLWSSGWG